MSIQRLIGFSLAPSDDGCAGFAAPRHDLGVGFTRHPWCRDIIETLDLENGFGSLAPRTGHAFDQYDTQAGMVDYFAETAILEHGLSPVL
jgi:hypothetical protein